MPYLQISISCHTCTYLSLAIPASIYPLSYLHIYIPWHTCTYLSLGIPAHIYPLSYLHISIPCHTCTYLSPHPCTAPLPASSQQTPLAVFCWILCHGQSSSDSRDPPAPSSTPRTLLPIPPAAPASPIRHPGLLSSAEEKKMSDLDKDTLMDLFRKAVFIKPARSAGFSRIKKIPYQAPPNQLGPRKCTF